MKKMCTIEDIRKVRAEFGDDLPALYAEVVTNREIIERLKRHITIHEQTLMELAG